MSGEGVSVTGKWAVTGSTGFIRDLKECVWRNNSLRHAHGCPHLSYHLTCSPSHRQHLFMSPASQVTYLPLFILVITSSHSIHVYIFKSDTHFPLFHLFKLWHRCRVNLPDSRSVNELVFVICHPGVFVRHRHRSVYYCPAGLAAWRVQQVKWSNTKAWMTKRTHHLRPVKRHQLMSRFHVTPGVSPHFSLLSWSLSFSCFVNFFPNDRLVSFLSNSHFPLFMRVAPFNLSLICSSSVFFFPPMLPAIYIGAFSFFCPLTRNWQFQHPVQLRPESLF